MDIDDIVLDAVEMARLNGWAPAPIKTLLHIHSEVSEAYNAFEQGDLHLRVENGKPEGFVSELADIVILSAFLAGVMNLRLDDAIQQKLAYNKVRENRD